MPQKYPGFIIDRSRRSEQSKHTDDFLVCTDLEVGFIAKLYKVNKTQYDVHNKIVDATPDADLRFISKTINANVACVLEIVHYTHSPVVEKSRLKSLMKKALSAYLYGEVKEVVGDGSKIDLQISAIEEVRRLAIAQFDTVATNSGVDGTQLFLDGINGAIDSLKLFKKFIDVTGNREN